MRTIVINTSKEAKNTKLNILFEAPFDRSSLIWYDSELADLGELACDIKQALIDETKTIDRDYNLIVLIDLYKLPRGNDKSAIRIYKALLTNYIRYNLVYRLHDEFNLMPSGVAVYFADSAKLENNFSLDQLKHKNPLEQQKAEQEDDRVQTMLFERNGDGELDDEGIYVPAKEKENERDYSEKLIMELFSWNEETDIDSLNWKLAVSMESKEYLDFSGVFKDAVLSIKNSDRSADVLSIAIGSVTDVIDDSKFNGDWDSSMSASFLLSVSSEININCISYHFVRDNEQSLTEGIFKIFVNIYSCVQKCELSKSFVEYDKDEIKRILVYAWKKYKYFSDEKNVKIEIESVADIFKRRKEIYAKQKESASKFNGFGSKSREEKLAMIKTVDAEDAEPAETDTLATPTMHGIDREFYLLVDDIFKNYDENVIRAQNNKIVKHCLKGLWKWRDKQNNEAFLENVRLVLKADSLKGRSDEADFDDSKSDILLIKDEHEREYTELIDSVTEAEHKLVANQNILYETKELILKYGDLMRKGKRYLISFVGALVAVLASVFPYLYVHTYSVNSNMIHKVLFYLLTAGFVLLYCIAAAIYMYKINKKKRLLRDELKKLKEQSEEERNKSILALCDFYSDTIIETESHCLLWREILRRDRENSQKGIMRNNHRKRLEELAEALKRFATLLKLDFDTAVEESGSEAFENIELCVEESFYSPKNRAIYSILPENVVEGQKQEEGEDDR